jgi:hypothetical protein
MSAHVSIQPPLPVQHSTAHLIVEAEEAIIALEAIDYDYQRERDAIQQCSVSERDKARMLGRLQADRQAKREPLVQRMLTLRHLLQKRM